MSFGGTARGSRRGIRGARMPRVGSAVKYPLNGPLEEVSQRAETEPDRSGGDVHVLNPVLDVASSDRRYGLVRAEEPDEQSEDLPESGRRPWRDLLSANPARQVVEADLFQGHLRDALWRNGGQHLEGRGLDSMKRLSGFDGPALWRPDPSGGISGHESVQNGPPIEDVHRREPNAGRPQVASFREPLQPLPDLVRLDRREQPIRPDSLGEQAKGLLVRPRCRWRDLSRRQPLPHILVRELAHRQRSPLVLGHEFRLLTNCTLSAEVACSCCWPAVNSGDP